MTAMTFEMVYVMVEHQ